jgi:hypothetical protein
MALLVGAVGLVVAAWAIGPALATGLSSGSRTVGAGNSAVPRCDTDGVSTLFVLTSTNVTGVTVSGISSGCGSKTLFLTLTNGATTVNGSAAIPAGGGSVTVTLSGTIPVTVPNVLRTDISVT